MIRRGHRSFSLIEALVALMVFSVVIISITEALTVQVRAQNAAEDQTRTVILAENILEELRYQTLLEEEEREGTYEGSNAGFSWWYKTEATDLPSLWKVTVRVSNGDRSHETEAYIKL